MKSQTAQNDDDQSGESATDFFEIQRNLITLIDDYRKTHGVNNKKMSLKGFSEHAGISVPIITAITNGNRWAAKASRETVVKLANALEIPVMQVYILSGFIKSQDVVYTGNIQGTLELIYRRMAKDTAFQAETPTEKAWKALPKKKKAFLAMSYLEMVKDPNMTFKLPSREVWDKWPQSAQIAFVMMYEDLTKKILLRYITIPK